MKLRFLMLLCMASVASAQKYYDKTTIQPGSNIYSDSYYNIFAKGLFATQTLVLPGTYTRCTAPQNVLCATTSLTGSTVSGNYSAIDYLFTASGFSNTSASALVNALGVEMDAGGSSNVGGFSGFYSKVKQTALTGNFAAGKISNWAGATFEVRANANEGGTAGSGNGWGTLFGFNPTVFLNPGATYWRGLTGGEIDITAASGSSVENIIGLHIVQTDASVVAGSRENIGFDLDNGSTAAGWDLGWSLGNYDGYFPLASTGTVLGCFRHASSGTSCGTTTNGIDFDNGSSSKVVFTGKAFRSTGFSVDGSGKLTSLTQTIAPGTSLSQATWGTLGIGMIVGANASFNDTTTGSGTVSENAAYAFQAPTFTNTQGTANTLSNADTLYVAAPLCGSGWAACTNLYAISTPGKVFVSGGAVLRGGSGVNINPNANFDTNINTGTSTGTTTIGNSLSTLTILAPSTVNKNSSTNTTEIGDGTTTGTVTIGGGSNAVTVNSNAFTVTNSTGANIPVNLWNWGFPVGIPPSGFFQNNGVYIVGQAPSNSATLSVSGTSGSVTATFNAVTLLGTAADVARIITICDGNCTATTPSTYKYCTITVQSSTTVATCTLSGTLSGTGAFANNKLWLSGTPTTNTSAFSVPLATAFAGAYMYFPANAIVSGSSAGMYYAICTTTTVCTVYNNTLASGKPVSIGSPTAFSSTGPGAFTQATTGQSLLTLAIPADSMGTQGSLVLTEYASRNSNTDTVVFANTYGGTTVAQVAAASVTWYGMQRTVRNVGSASSQVFLASAANVASDIVTNNNAVPSYGAIDSTSSQNLIVRGTLTTAATDYLFVIGGTVAANYSGAN